MAFSNPSFPPEADSVRSKSGTPEVFEVNAIDPLAIAARGRPEGARVTCSVSRISTYSSLLVCRTLARRQGIAGPFELGVSLSWCFRPPEGNEAGELLRPCQPANISMFGDPSNPYPGRPTPPSNLSIHPGISTSSLNALGSVLHTLPASHISPSS